MRNARRSNLRQRLFSVIFVFLTSHVAQAQTATQCQVGSGSVLVFANGVNGTPSAALNSTLELISALTGQPDGTGFTEATVAYNTSYGQTTDPEFADLLDIVEALAQLQSSNYSQAARWLSRLDVLPDSVQSLFARITAAYDANFVASGDLEKQLARYKDALNRGNKVVIVAHSQGNFFANQGWNSLTTLEQQSVGIVAVATPASFVADGGPHFTSFVDAVIVPLIASGAKFPNVSNAVTSADYSGHGFNESYMRPGAVSRNLILAAIKNVDTRLVAPLPIYGSGIITVTLTWGSQPDVDLHAFEPNGAHVFWENEIGPSGSLDRDETDGFGPEHYVVSCDSLEAGTYAIGVNYYSGFAPEVANVQVAAGLNIRNFSVSLANPVGSEGDLSPILFAQILVTGSSTQGYDLQILNLGP